MGGPSPAQNLGPQWCPHARIPAEDPQCYGGGKWGTNQALQAGVLGYHTPSHWVRPGCGMRGAGGGEWGVHAKGVMQGEPGGVQPGGYHCSGETEAGRREERGSGCS